MSCPSGAAPTLPLAPKKQNPPSQRFWRGGIREPSRFLIAQLTGSLHTGEGTKTRTPQTTTLARCRQRLFIVVQRIHRWYRSQGLAASRKSQQAAERRKNTAHTAQAVVGQLENEQAL